MSLTNTYHEWPVFNDQEGVPQAFLVPVSRAVVPNSNITARHALGLLVLLFSGDFPKEGIQREGPINCGITWNLHVQDR